MRDFEGAAARGSEPVIGSVGLGSVGAGKREGPGVQGRIDDREAEVGIVARPAGAARIAEGVEAGTSARAAGTASAEAAAGTARAAAPHHAAGSTGTAGAAAGSTASAASTTGPAGAGTGAG